MARPSFAAEAAVLAATALLAVSAAGAPAGAPKDAAAMAFDEGVARFEHADYAAAARAFLKADDLSPSADAESNAIAAARRANDQMLVVDAAERALARAGSNPDLARQAREALAEASRSLARVELGCQPAPCSVWIDGAAVEPGTRYILPGVHITSAKGNAGAQIDQSVSLAAGGTYELLLKLPAPTDSSPATPPVAMPSSPPAPDAMPTPVSSPPSDAAGAPSGSKKPLSPVIFYVGAGITAVLTGVTIWSGVDTLTAKSDLSKTPSQPDIDGVRSKEHRSDALFASTVVVGAATAVTALLWVDWGGGGHAAASVAPIPGGVVAQASGRF
jgi:hypothetical protein